jgi:hypothetical protein
MATYLLNNDYTKKSCEEWEKEVLIYAIHKYNAKGGSFATEYAKYFKLTLKGTSWILVIKS